MVNLPCEWLGLPLFGLSSPGRLRLRRRWSGRRSARTCDVLGPGQGSSDDFFNVVQSDKNKRYRNANFAQIRPIPYKFGKNTWTYTPVYCLQIRPISHKFGQIRANLVNVVCFHNCLIYGTVCYGTVSSVSSFTSALDFKLMSREV